MVALKYVTTAGGKSMYFYRDDIETLEGYGTVVSASTFMNRLEEAMRDSNIIFEPEYQDKGYVQINTALEVFNSLKYIK